MSNNNINNPHIRANQAFYNQEAFYNNNSNNNLPVNAVPAYPINNVNHSSGPSSAPQIQNNTTNTYNYYDNNYLVSNYVSFINNYISTMNNSIDYLNNSSNTIRQMSNELGRMHYNLDYYYYNLYRNNLNVQRNIQSDYRDYFSFSNLQDNQYETPLQEQMINEDQDHELEPELEPELQPEPELEPEDNNEFSVLNLDFNHEHYEELSNTNINNCINANINNVTYSSITNPVNNSCAISQEDFEPNEEVSVFNYCGHVFKKDPLNTWLLRHQTCPNCRFNILTNSNLIKYSSRSGSFKYFLTLDQFRYILANNIINRFFNRPATDSSNNTMSFVIRR